MSPFRIGPRFEAGLVMALVFVVGGLAGAVADRTVHLPARPHAEGRPPMGPGGPGGRGGPDGGRPGDRAQRREQFRERFVQQMTQDLSLEPAQVARIDSITRRQNVRMDSLRKAMWPRFDTIIKETRTEIEHVLTPEQRVKLEEQFKQRQAHRQAGDRPHGPGMDTTGGKR